MSVKGKLFGFGLAVAAASAIEVNIGKDAAVVAEEARKCNQAHAGVKVSKALERCFDDINGDAFYENKYADVTTALPPLPEAGQPMATATEWQSLAKSKADNDNFDKSDVLLQSAGLFAVGLVFKAYAFPSGGSSSHSPTSSGSTSPGTSIVLRPKGDIDRG